MRKPSQRKNKAVFRAAATSAAVVGALVLAGCTASGNTADDFVTAATLPTPTPGPNGTIERPSTPAPLIAADGECLTLFTDMRDLMGRYDTGRAERSPADNDKFNQYLNQINLSKAGDGPCTPQQAEAFMVQEVGQWMLWTPSVSQSADDSSVPQPQITGKAG